MSYTGLRKLLKGKKMLFTHLDSENKNNYSYQNWYLPLQKIFGTVITFSPKRNYFQYGKEKMNSMFLELVRREQPDYIFFLLLYDEFDPLILMKVREIAPHAILINLFGDDSWRYEDFGRYYALFFDYIITAYHKAVGYHMKDGINNVSFTVGVNLENFRKLNISKKYDVVFIGRPGNERSEYLQYLIQNGINVHIWGEGWKNYPKLASNCHGPLKAEELVKVVNESKINLSFTQGGDGKPQFKGRPIEVSACGSFSLVGYFDEYLDFFTEGKELIMFRDKEDLLKKINYYLKYEQERERIAKAAYRRVIRDYTIEQELTHLFTKLTRISPASPRDLRSRYKNIAYLNNQDIWSEQLKSVVQNSDYVCFTHQKTSEHPYKVFLQSYALKKSGKDICCSDYYVNSSPLGTYLLFKASFSFKNLKSSDFHSLIQPSQLMVKKDFFLRNLSEFRKLFLGGSQELCTLQNTVFVSIPLATLRHLPAISNYSLVKKAFQMKFLDNLYALQYQRKLYFALYLLNLAIFSWRKNLFLLKALKDSLLDSSKRMKLKKWF